MPSASASSPSKSPVTPARTRFSGLRLEEQDELATSHYWISHKKASLNLLVDDTPFAMDRQLEDQRFSIHNNRNPQLHAQTRADKTRSETMVAKKGAIRDISMKAKVLNKIVREESGQHTYTLVPPLAEAGHQQGAEAAVDPMTHPLFRPYALEMKQKPVVQSFGHRPSSASRTFNPATMKVRLRHGSVAKQEKPAHATGFGIPVAVLTKVLKAPELSRNEGPSGVDGDDENDDGGDWDGEHAAGPLHDPNSLFPSEEDMSSLLKSPTKGQGKAAKAGKGGGAKVGFDEASIGASTASQLSRTSTTAGSGGNVGGEAALKAKGKRFRGMSIFSGMSYDDGSDTSSKRSLGLGSGSAVTPVKNRPEWSESFIHDKRTLAEKFAAKSPVIFGRDEMSISERLNRFNKAAASMASPGPFCSEKYINDKLVSSTGKPIKVKVPVPVFAEYGPAEDPKNEVILELKKERVAKEKKRDKKLKHKLHSLSAWNVPDVSYNPLTALALMRSGEGGRLYERATDSGSPAAYMSKSMDRKHEAERDFVLALQAARLGDRRALVDYYMARGGDGGDGDGHAVGVSPLPPLGAGKTGGDDVEAFLNHEADVSPYGGANAFTFNDGAGLDEYDS